MFLKREDAETETVATTEVKRLSSPGVLDQVSEENDTNKSSGKVTLFINIYKFMLRH